MINEGLDLHHRGHALVKKLRKAIDKDRRLLASRGAHWPNWCQVLLLPGIGN
jgi:hypothetical protein